MFEESDLAISLELFIIEQIDNQQSNIFSNWSTKSI